MRKLIVLFFAFILFGCKKEIIQNKSDMKQIFYTEEGNPYVVKTVTKNISGVNFAGSSLSIRAFVNRSPVVGVFENSTIELKTNKKIIPLSASFSCVNPTGFTILADITSSYYNCSTGDSPAITNYSYQKSFSKMIPYITRNFYTNDNFYSYSFQYNQVVFSDGDFIDTDSGVSFVFGPDLATILGGYSASFSIPASNPLTFNITFTYYEML